MTTREFMDALERVRDRFEWSLLPDRGWTSERRARPRLHLRALARHGPATGMVFEPIGAVCYALTGAIHGEKSWRDAAEALDLFSIAAAELTAAVNDHTWAGAEGAREPVEHLQALRDRLIATLRLDGVKPPSGGLHLPRTSRKD